MPTVTQHWIAGGDWGTLQTLAHMRRLARAGSREGLTESVAAHIVQPYPPHDFTRRARALRAWLAGRFVFHADPKGVELLHEPVVLLHQIERQGHAVGDCDDAAMLGAALALAAGQRVRFQVIGFREALAPYRHVWADVLGNGGAWVDLDVTRPQQPTNPVTRTMVYDV